MVKLWVDEQRKQSIEALKQPSATRVVVDGGDAWLFELDANWEYHEGVGVLFTCDDVKWHDSYPDVQLFSRMQGLFIDRFIEASEIEGVHVHDMDETPFAYEFMRAGEEHHDVVVTRHGDYQRYISFSRSIMVDISAPPPKEPAA